MFRYLGLPICAAALSGCTTTWYHPHIADEGLKQKQLAIDEGYCTRAAHGAVPMPQVNQNPTGFSNSQFSGTGQTTNPDGTVSRHSFNGHSYTAPPSGAAFSTGFANGVGLGLALRAKKAQEKAFRGCMIAFGWSPTPVEVQATAEHGREIIARPSLPTSAEIYASLEDQWIAEINEFLTLYPEYEAGTDRYDALDAEVKKVAHVAPDGMSGPQVLLSAHFRLGNEPSNAMPRRLYEGAANGDALDQAALAVSFAQGLGDLPIDYSRALYWASQSGMAGNEIGLSVAGMLIFHGHGIPENKVRGYLLFKQASEAGYEGGDDMLSRLRLLMSQSELMQVGERP